jgi:hypothetical protein
MSHHRHAVLVWGVSGWETGKRSRLHGEHIMAEDHKFVPSDTSFDPETVNLLSDAFEQAWHKVRTSGNRLARPGYARMMREVMAKHIFNLAEHGERDESKLSDSAFQFFTANYKAYAASVGGRTDPRF